MHKFVLLSAVFQGNCICQWAGHGGVNEKDEAQGGVFSAGMVSTGTSLESLLWDGDWDQGWKPGET